MLSRRIFSRTEYQSTSTEMRLACVLAVLPNLLAAVEGICASSCTWEVQHRLAEGSTCIKRILFVSEGEGGLSEFLACERVANSYQRACGPCRPDAARDGPSAMNEVWAGPQGRSNGACRSADGSGTFVVAPLQTHSACRVACASQPTCVAYEFVRVLVHGRKRSLA